MGDSPCAKNKFQKISSFYKVVFYAHIALQRTPKQTPCGASLSSSSLTSQKIYDIVLVTLEYRCLSRFSRSRRGRLGTSHATGTMLFFFPLLFLPLLFPRRISLTSLSLSLSLSLCYHSEIVHIQAGQCGNQIGAKFWEVRFSRVKQLCSFLSFDDDDEHHFPFFSLPVGG